MNHRELRTKSKYLAKVLRHEPEGLGIELDSEGWVSVNDLIGNSNGYFTFDILTQITNSDKKGRYSIKEIGGVYYIRANQGHSTKTVDLSFEVLSDFDVHLYHGTPTRNVESIFKHGLRKMDRHHVHLSTDLQTAMDVGFRRASEITILRVDYESMTKKGHLFYMSNNGVVLSDDISPIYLYKHITKHI